MSETTRTLDRGSLGAVLVVLAAAMVAAAQPGVDEGAKDKLLPGAKLLHKFAKEVYRIPVLLETKQDPRLLVWVDAFDPAPVPKFPGEMMPKPKFDLVFWDVKENKEAHKIAFPDDASAPLSPVPAGMTSPAMIGKFGALALSPDAKRLASVSTVYRMVPGKVQHVPTAYVSIYDPAKRKWERAHAYEGQDGPQVLFAPDGDLVILKDKSWAIQEPGKPKPRKLFKLTRSPFFAPKPNTYSIYAIRNAVLSPDAEQLAVAADGLVTVYDVKTGAVILQAERAAPDSKGAASGQNTESVELAFAPTAKGPALLAVETVTGPPKSFVLARLFDLKAKKQTGRQVLAEEKTKGNPFGGAVVPAWGRPAAYFNAKGDPRVLFNGKLLDAATAKALQQFDAGFGVIVSRDGQYLVRLTQKQGDKKLGVELWSLDNSQ